MKTKIFILIAMLLFTAWASISQAAAATQLSVPSLNVTLLNQDPDPVSPGRYVDLRFKIANNGFQSTAKGLEVMIVPSYPFSLDPGEESAKSIGDLPTTGTNNVAIVKYKVRVADDAVEGTNPIILKYRVGSSEWISQEFNVNIQTVDANLGIISIETTPENIRPGEQTQLNIKVKNMADSVMRDITLKLDLTFSNIIQNRASMTAADSIAAYNALPFAPIGSASEQKVDMLKPGEEHTFVYDLMTYPDAATKVYKVPIQLSYQDELQKEYTKDDLIGLVVGSKPDLSAVLDSTTLIAGKRSGNVIVKFVNKGVTGVKFLDVSLAPSDGFDVTSSKEVYVGSVDSDDYETAEFSVYVKDAAAKEIRLPVIASYLDSNNKRYNETYDLVISLPTSQQLGQGGGVSAAGLIGIVAIVGGGVWLISRRRSHKAK